VENRSTFDIRWFFSKNRQVTSKFEFNMFQPISLKNFQWKPKEDHENHQMHYFSSSFAYVTVRNFKRKKL